MKYDERHGSPYDRGATDCYYGRIARPHKYLGSVLKGKRVELTDQKEIEAYYAGYEQQTDRKEFS